VAAFVTLNALRRYLNDHGCMEQRILRSASSERFHIEFFCRTKTGRHCRAVLGADHSGAEIPANLLARLGRELAPCLGRGWIARIPAEDPFG
jgi:hypothetical protein